MKEEKKKCEDCKSLDRPECYTIGHCEHPDNIHVSVNGQKTYRFSPDWKNANGDCGWFEKKE